MNVGILTFYDGFNYGAVCQAYALQEILRDLGVTPEIIAFERKRLLVQQARSRPQSLSSRLMGKVSWRRLESKVVTRLHRDAIARRAERFDQFRASHVNISSERYVTAEQLKKSPPQYDAYICGSDQIWNPYHNAYIRLFMAEFAAPEKIRIAYAPSFGVDSIAGCQEYDEIVAAMCAMDHLSAREQSGVDIILRTCGRSAQRVLDPTMLLTADQWAPLCVGDRPRRPYILFYAVAPYNRRILRSLMVLRHREGCDIVVLPGGRHNFYNHFVKGFDAGPLEFLSLIRHAKAVVTNSFHGTVFSIVFQRPFWSFIGVNDKSRSTAARIIETLRLFGLSSHLLKPNALFFRSPPSFDMESVSQLLELERERSIQYLRSALSV